MHLNLIRLFAFAACVLAGALAIRFCEGNRRGRRPLAAAITVIYLTALCCDTLFSRTELAETAEIGAHSAGAGAAILCGMSFRDGNSGTASLQGLSRASSSNRSRALRL